MECTDLPLAVNSIVKPFPNPEKLTVIAKNSYPVYVASWLQFTTLQGLRGQRGVENQLFELKDTLEHLHLEFSLQHETLHRLGDESRLSNLAMHWKLKHIRIQIGALCVHYSPHRNEDFMNQSSLAFSPFCYNLPDSLQSLELVESIRMTFQPDLSNGVAVRLWRAGEYEQALCSMVLNFCVLKPQKQPNLKKFCFVAARDTRSLREYLTPIKNACAARDTVVEIEIAHRTRRVLI